MKSSLFCLLVWFAFAAPVRAADVMGHENLIVFGGFVTTDPTGCITTSVHLSGQEDTTRAPGEPPRSSSTFDISSSTFDSCTSAFSSLVGQSSTIEITTVGNLGIVTVTGTIDLCDRLSVCRPFEVNLTWRATIDPLRSIAMQHDFCGQGCTNHNRVRAVIQPAEGTGTITDGFVNLTPAPSLFGHVSSFSVDTVHP